MATAAKTKGQKVTKLQSILKLTGQGVRDRRSGNLYIRLDNANEDKLRQLAREKADLEFRILDHLDLAPTSKDSLKVVNIDADEWNTTLAEFYVELKEIEDTEEIYTRIRTDLFTPKTAAELAADDFLGTAGNTEEEDQE